MMMTHEEHVAAGMNLLFAAMDRPREETTVEPEEVGAFGTCAGCQQPLDEAACIDVAACATYCLQCWEEKYEDCPACGAYREVGTTDWYGGHVLDCSHATVTAEDADETEDCGVSRGEIMEAMR